MGARGNKLTFSSKEIVEGRKDERITTDYKYYIPPPGNFDLLIKDT